MKFTIKIINSSPTHTAFVLYCNGACAGGLCLREEEFMEFKKKLI